MDELLARLRRFQDDYFPGVAHTFRALVRDGQHPTTLFVGCSDSRIIEDGEVHVFDVRRGGFVCAAESAHSGTGPYLTYDDAGP